MSDGSSQAYSDHLRHIERAEKLFGELDNDALIDEVVRLEGAVAKLRDEKRQIEIQLEPQVERLSLAKSLIYERRDQAARGKR